MTRTTSWAIFLCAIFLVACAGPSQPLQTSETSTRLFYNLTNAEQMRKADLVGHVVEICRKGKPCSFGTTRFVLVVKQDGLSINSKGGETILYSGIQHLSYAASKSDEIENDRMQALILRSLKVCMAVRDDCWR